MIFVTNSLKYDTTKMELVSTKCEYKYIGTRSSGESGADGVYY